MKVRSVETDVIGRRAPFAPLFGEFNLIDCERLDAALSQESGQGPPATADLQTLEVVIQNEGIEKVADIPLGMAAAAFLVVLWQILGDRKGRL